MKRRFLLQTLASLAGTALAPGLMAQTRPRVEVWKDPDCGCCKDWISHLEANGFQVKVHDSGNAAARARLGVPEKMGSCHTAQVGGYAIEGHVPARDIRRLLKERPRPWAWPCRACRSARRVWTGLPTRGAKTRMTCC